MSAQDDSPGIDSGNYSIVGQNLDNVASMGNTGGHLRSVFRKQLDAADLFCPPHIESRMSGAVDTCERRMEEAVHACRVALSAYRSCYIQAGYVDQRIADLRALVRVEGPV